MYTFTNFFHNYSNENAEFKNSHQRPQSSGEEFMGKLLKINGLLLKHTDIEQRVKALEPGGPDCQLSLHSLLLGYLWKILFLSISVSLSI